jgi:hypothetical protein
MSKTSHVMRAAVAAAVLVASGGAFAEGTFTPELGFGQTSGKHVLQGDGTQRGHDLAFTAAFGYELENGYGARAMAIGDFDIQTAFGPNTYRTFDNFVGVQATGKVALASALNLRGGLGIGRSNLVGDGHELVTDGIVSVGLQWRPASHYAMEVRFDYLTKTGTNLIGLQFQVPF